MIKKLAIVHSLDKVTYTILRRRSNGYIYNATAGAAEELGTWNNSRKAECSISLTDRGGGYYTEEFPAGCEDGVWDAFYFERLGASVDINDRLLNREKFINGSASIEERSMLAAGHSIDKTIYAIIRSQSDADVWDAGDEALEEVGTWDNARKAECALAMADKEGGYYTAVFPPACTTAGTYHIFYNEKLGGQFDIEDRLIGRDKVLWFGTAVADEVVPTGARGKAMVNLRDLIAECESFQAWTGAAGSQEAKNYLFMTAYAPANGIFTKPFGLVCRTENDKDETIAVDEDNVGGDLELRFEDTIPVDYEEVPKNAELYFLNMVEAVLAEMWVLSRQAGKFAINSITLIEGPTQYEETAGKYVNGTRLMVNWGIVS